MIEVLLALVPQGEESSIYTSQVRAYLEQAHSLCTQVPYEHG